MKDILIKIIPGMLGWIGGDSASFTSQEVATALGVYEPETFEALKILTKRNIISEKEGKYRVTKWGSYTIDYSLLNIIAQWALESSIYSEPIFSTLQWLYARHVGLPSKRLPYGIRESYILDFCQNFLRELTNLIPQYSLTDYSTLRNFMIRISLNPEHTFLMSGNPSIRELLDLFVKSKVAKIQLTDTSCSFLIFDSSKLEGLLGRYRKVKTANTKL
jgi:hypothetical protein